jgi:alpha-beta hydrolase superfamily lysophospholipase
MDSPASPHDELVTTCVGTGAAVVLVHGIGIGPATFEPVADRLAAAGYRAVIVHRPGYGDAAGQGPRPAAAQLDLLWGLLGGGACRRPAALVGVGAGATLALLLAVRLSAAAAASDVDGHAAAPFPVVAHEPLLGPVAPAAHHRMRRAVSALGRPGGTPSPVATTGFVRRRAGDAAWARLPEDERAAVVARAALVTAEARAFVELAPSAADLARLRPWPVVATVGAASGQEPRAAAAVLSSLTRARVEALPGAAHLPQVDAPGALADVALRALGDADARGRPGIPPVGPAAQAGAVAIAGASAAAGAHRAVGAVTGPAPVGAVGAPGTPGPGARGLGRPPGNAS